MRRTIDGVTYDTATMLDLHIGPVRRWMGDEIDLAGVYADREGRLFIEEHRVSTLVVDPTDSLASDRQFLQVSAPAHLRESLTTRKTLTRCNAQVTAYLVQRFALPNVYLRSEDHP